MQTVIKVPIPNPSYLSVGGSMVVVVGCVVVSSVIMEAYDYLLDDILFFIYNATWLIYLTKKHYGQVTTTAGHIFELNVLVTLTLESIYFILVVDLEVLPMGIMSDLFDKFFFFSFIGAIAGSQIETAIFLKTLNVNTMMTNTAGKIIVALTIFSYAMALITTLVLPSPRVQQCAGMIYITHHSSLLYRFM